ncbi:MAG TPA: CofH family radical SAM protein [Phycisphaerae bacterium]|nr:CofH family radical SAM protein [Phycisphaerae bacterium]HRR84176.1 CofH family radical SAM protein [Phycisphaerae bacterium]
MKGSVPTELQAIADKIRAGQRLEPQEGLLLYESADIHTLGEWANLVRERLHGRRTYYNINRHINYTNYCVLRCRFCSFYRPWPERRSQDGSPATRGSLEQGNCIPSDAPGYELSNDQIVEMARAAADRGATEVHIVGGLHPHWPLEHYVDMCRRIRQACPQLHIKAFTAVEIVHFSRISRPRRSIREVLEALRDAGLGSLPGGGAEIFDQRVHDETFKSKIGEQDWFDVHRTAHEMGIFSNATMLYGHVETPAERIAHLVKLRRHQDASLAARPAHFNCVVPLSFIPAGSQLAHLPEPTGLTDLRTLAITRLMLDNFPHVKAFWVMTSTRLAQVSLNWGVDDIDGTVVHYEITHRHGGQSRRQEMTADDLKRLIIEAGGIPIERDTLYREVIRTTDGWTIRNPA